MINNNDLFINIDQNLPPIEQEDKKILIKLNYDTNIKDTDIQNFYLNIMDTKNDDDNISIEINKEYRKNNIININYSLLDNDLTDPDDDVNNWENVEYWDEYKEYIGGKFFQNNGSLYYCNEKIEAPKSNLSPEDWFKKGFIFEGNSLSYYTGNLALIENMIYQCKNDDIVFSTDNIDDNWDIIGSWNRIPQWNENKKYKINYCVFDSDEKNIYISKQDNNLNKTLDNINYWKKLKELGENEKVKKIQLWNKDKIYSNGDFVFILNTNNNNKYLYEYKNEFNNSSKFIKNLNPSIWEKIIDWNENTIYNVNDYMKHNGTLYKSTKDNNQASSFIENDWEIELNNIENWNKYCGYQAYTCVKIDKIDDEYYYCKEEIEQPPGNSINLAQKIEVKDWNKNFNYKKNDFILFNGEIYKAKNNRNGKKDSDIIKSYNKIQLKIKTNNDKIYYSNYGIAQIIDKDNWGLYLNLENDNIFHIQYFTCLQDNLLKLYRYKIVDENNNVFFNQDWVLNSEENNSIEYKNEKNWYKTNIYIKNIILNPVKEYKIIFEGITSLGLTLRKEENINYYDFYPIIFPATINLTNDYNNGCIIISFNSLLKKTLSKDYFLDYDHYELYRSDEFSDFEKWEYLTNFYVNQYNIKTFKFKDYQTKQGIKYQYGIKGVNSNNIKTQMLKSSSYIIADYEDMFLIDQDMIIKIRYNPKMSTFKTNKNENKIETLGEQYPFITRNGNLKYKEMNISGLITFQMDEEELIYDNYIKNISRDSDWRQKQFIKNNNINLINTDLVDYNITKERVYKNKILDWLNNNKYKVLKTPTEGNFIVQLLNINLQPIDSLGRMLHSFQAIAYEVDDYNYENIIKYNIVSTQGIKEEVLMIESEIIEMEKDPSILKYTGGKTFESENKEILDQLWCFGFDEGTFATSGYLNPEDDHEYIQDDNYIGRTGELIINNANGLKSIGFEQDEKNKLECGITYSYIKNNENISSAKKLILLEKNRKFKIESLKEVSDTTTGTSSSSGSSGTSSSSVSTENQNKKDYVDYIKIENNRGNLISKYSYEIATRKSSSDGFFLFGNNLFDNSNKKIKSYLFSDDSDYIQNIYILNSIIIYKKTDVNNEDDNIKSSFFIGSNNLKTDYGIKPNFRYLVPDFSFIKLNNLEDIDFLWLGNNLTADIAYNKYIYTKANDEQFQRLIEEEEIVDEDFISYIENI